jgi:exopolysaccharide production protein ExoQ
MPPALALVIWLVLLLGLLCLDPARKPETSLALWIPVAWMFIVASRLPSQWLGSQTGSAAQAYQEGNSLDRAVFLCLMLLAAAVLTSRSFQWTKFFSANVALVVFISFALASVLWSDFPLISLKRWIRDLGTYLVILVVLSDPRPIEAVRTVLRRLAYFLIPLSILLEKYYPAIGRQYEEWTGSTMIVGAMEQKNDLGAVCLISGIFFFWDTLTRWPGRKERHTKKIILMNLAFLAMTVWLLYIAQSATSSVCLVIGCLVVAAVRSRWGQRHVALLKFLLPSSFCVYLIAAYGLGLSGFLNSAVGRNATFTDRTILWNILLSTKTNPLIGTGYASFWLPPRLYVVWRAFGATINEAHNGFLEVYLELGAIGVISLVVFLMASYRSIWRRMDSTNGLLSLSAALWVVALFYNMTEAAFKIHVMWMALLLGAMYVPPREQTVPVLAPFKEGRATPPLRRLPAETIVRR